MPEERFDIFFSGKLIDEQEAAQARERIRKLFNASDAQLERLFSGKPVAVKKAVDLDSATRYRLAFRKAGALIDIRPSSASAAQAATQRATNKVGLTLEPPNSGSLETFAPIVQAQALPDISGLRLEAPGAPIDTTPAPQKAHIANEQFNLVQDSNWSLEDCQPESLPLPERDISHLDLATADDESHIPPPPKPAPLPDISALKLLEPEVDSKKPDAD